MEPTMEATMEVPDEDLECHEEDLQNVLNDDEQVEIDHLNNIRIYLRNQLPALSVTGVDPTLRASIVDKMLSDSDGLLYPEAVHLAVQLLDRYFATFSQVEAVEALNPHKVASSALCVSMKHVYDIEVGAPDATFSQVEAEKALNPHKVASSALCVSMKPVYAIKVGAPDAGAQFKILNRIHYRLNTPTTKKLVDAFLASTGPHDPKLLYLCSYLTELALLDRDCSGFQISELAAGCLFLGQFVLDSANPPNVRAPWDCNAQRLRDVVTILHELFLSRRLPQCQLVRTKYTWSKFFHVATLACPGEIPIHYF